MPAAADAKRAAAAIYVHGLWMPGAEGWFLRRRLAAEYGLPVATFRYHSRQQSVSATTAALHRQVQRLVIGLDPVAGMLHFVGHSLGGIVILRYFERYAPSHPGRVMLLGTPALGCAMAQRLGESGLGRTLMGPTVAQELLQPQQRRWSFSQELGIIAGTHSLSVGRVMLRLPEPNDGTVAVSETRLPGAAACLCLPVSHTGMLFSRQLAHQTGCFLAHGHFDT
jgi:pimeloyl-ACP methyl ester carboxylesterase